MAKGIFFLLSILTFDANAHVTKCKLRDCGVTAEYLLITVHVGEEMSFCVLLDNTNLGAKGIESLPFVRKRNKELLCKFSIGMGLPFCQESENENISMKVNVRFKDYNY